MNFMAGILQCFVQKVEKFFELLRGAHHNGKFLADKFIPGAVPAFV